MPSLSRGPEIAHASWMGASNSLWGLLRIAAPVAALAACGARGEAPPVVLNERTSIGRTVSSSSDAPALAPPPDAFCPQRGVYAPAEYAELTSGSPDALRDQARAVVRSVLGSTGVFVPPDETRGEWSFGVLSDEPIAERAGPDTARDFAFAFECPASDWFRIVRVWPSGTAVLLYPPAKMPGWQPLAAAAPRDVRDAPHPELVGRWTSRGCWLGGFSYDGRDVVLPIFTMRSWEFRTEDLLQRFPARWNDAVLQVEFAGGWQDYAKLLPDGSFVYQVPDTTCVLERVRDDEPCETARWFRPRPTVPDTLPLNTGPIIMRCGPGGCVTNQRSLVDAICTMHGMASPLGSGGPSPKTVD